MTAEPLEEHYEGARPVRTLMRLFAGQRWRITLAAVAFAFTSSPVWIMPLSRRLQAGIRLDVVNGRFGAYAALQGQGAGR
jgi:hypothetical protein